MTPRTNALSAAAILLFALLVACLWLFGAPWKTADTSGTAAAAILADAGSPPVPLRDYIEIVNSCGIHYDGTCVVARAAPATTSPVKAQLRDGIVLEVATTTVQADGHFWYKVIFTEWLRYPERVNGEWYVAADNTRFFTDSGDEELTAAEQTAALAAATSTRYIVIDRKTQTLSAYDGATLFLQSPVSTGLELTPTPRGTFVIYKKTPTRYMQGPLPGISDQYYDLPGVPWDLYFTAEGGAIHGAYWHNSFGEEWSHGCVNLPLDTARILYAWAPLGTIVYVKD